MYDSLRKQKTEGKTMTNTMTKTMPIRMLPPLNPEELKARRRAHRRRAVWNTLLEALTTIGLGTCFVFCAVMVLCVL